MIKYIFSILLLTITGLSQSPQFWITHIDKSEFPKVKINYNAVSNFGYPENKALLKLEDFIATENGVDLTLKDGNPNLKHNCGSLTKDIPISVVLAMDVTQSLQAGPTDYFEWIKEAANDFADSLKFIEDTQASIVDWAGSASWSGWFFDSLTLKNHIDDLIIKSGTTNFNKAFLESNGAIEKLKTAPENHRRVIIFFTDGEHQYQADPESFLWQQIRDLCLQNKIEVYTIEVNEANSNPYLEQLSSATGGYSVNIQSKSLLKEAFKNFYFRLQAKKSQCWLEYESNLSCSDDLNLRELKVDFIKYSNIKVVSDTKSFEVPESSKISLESDNNQFYFNKGATLTHKVKFTAKNADFIIDKPIITPDNANFTITPNLQNIKKGETKEFTITYKPEVYNLPEIYQLSFSSDNPCPLDNITLIAPCGVTSDLANINFTGPIVGPLFMKALKLKNNTKGKITGEIKLTDPSGKFSVNPNGAYELEIDEELNIEVNFQTSSAGNFNASLEITSNSDCGSLTIPINANTASDGFTFNLLDFGKIRAGVKSQIKTIDINHINIVTIKDVKIGTKSSNSFKITKINQTLPHTYDSNGEFTLDIEFTPNAVKTYTEDIILTLGDNSTYILKNALVGEGILSEITTNSPILFALTKVNDKSTKDLIITNASKSENLEIQEIRFKAGSNTEGNFTFSVGNNLNNRIVNINNGNISIPIDFSPKSIGAKTAIVEIIHNSEFGDLSFDEITEVQLNGNAFDDQTPTLVIDDYDFGNTYLCTSEDNVLIANCSQTNFIITLKIIDNENVFSVPDLPIISVTNEIPIPINFSPKEEKEYSAILEIYDGSGNLVASVNIKGTGKKLIYPVSINKEEHFNQIGDNIRIYACLPTNMTYKGFYKYTMELKYNSKQLFLKDLDSFYLNGNQNTINLFKNTLIDPVDSDYRILTYEFDSDMFNSVGLCLNAKFLALSYNNDKTDITISTKIEGDCFGFEEKSVDVTVDGCINELSGAINLGNYKLGDVSPNPVSKSLDFDLSIAIEAETKLELISSSGDIVATIINNIVKPGDYKISYPINEISDGIYFLKVQSLHFTDTKTILINK